MPETGGKSSIRVQRLDTGKVRTVQISDLRYWIPLPGDPEGKNLVACSVLRAKPNRGDVLYLRVTPRWAARVEELHVPDPAPRRGRLGEAFRKFLGREVPA